LQKICRLLANVSVRDKTFEPFISSTDIQKRVEEIGQEMNEMYKGTSPVFLAILNGSFMFFSDVMKCVNLPCELSFVKLASYQGMSSTGTVDQLIGLTESLQGRDVIVVEDIVDTGNTLTRILDVVKEKNPASVRVCTLLLKPEVFQNKHPLHFVGFDIPNEFVVGYGMDYDGHGRNLADIYKVSTQ